MICEKCNKNTATVHIVKIENGVKKQLMLCDKCAGNISDTNLTSKLEEIDSLRFKKIINVKSLLRNTPRRLSYAY